MTRQSIVPSAELQNKCDLAAQLPRPVKKTEDKLVAHVILRPAYCSLCKVQYYNAKMQCDTLLHHILAAQLPRPLRPSYCSLCKVQYCNAKMQCDTVLHHSLAAQLPRPVENNNLLGSFHTHTEA